MLRSKIHIISLPIVLIFAVAWIMIGCDEVQQPPVIPSHGPLMSPGVDKVLAITKNSQDGQIVCVAERSTVVAEGLTPVTGAIARPLNGSFEFGLYGPRNGAVDTPFNLLVATAADFLEEQNPGETAHELVETAFRLDDCGKLVEVSTASVTCAGQSICVEEGVNPLIVEVDGWKFEYLCIEFDLDDAIDLEAVLKGSSSFGDSYYLSLPGRMWVGSASYR